MALKLFRRGAAAGDDAAEMSFIDHLEVLRGHLLRSLLAIIVGAIIVGIFNKFFIQDVLMGPTHARFPTYGVMCRLGHFLQLGQTLCIEGLGVKMQSTTVSGQFSMWITIVLIGGVIIAFPYIFYEFWRFVKPALTDKELGRTRGVVFWVSFLFFIGVCFGYFLVAPYTINFFASFQIDETVENRWTITSYIDTMIPLVLGSGLAFQLPLVMIFLAKVGIVSSRYLASVRKYAIVIIFIVAGVITPGPDVISQLSVALPLILLYEISIILTRRVAVKEALEEAKEWS